MADAHSLMKDEADLQGFKKKLELAETISEIKAVIAAILDHRLAELRREAYEAPI
ncbi:hypothetical protein [Rhizobium sp. Leaf306]|jgi:hypothetical protein|uniref:hypothetical protein n=1 Tax=Rhizobium sp. Leaf306 TaxID=1736330 RepID=UPI000B232A7E|nr:hypothetical protein [Rhizobium sp. Leaf306]